MVNSITSIELCNDLGGTPARINIRTGKLFISVQSWLKMSPEEKQAVFSHEKGHIVKGTRVETEADHFALYDYKKRGLSSKAFVKTFTKHLNFNDPDHRARIAAVISSAIKQDYAAGNHGIINKLSNTIKNIDMMRYTDETAHITGFDGRGVVVDFGKAAKNRLANKLEKAKVNTEIGQMKDTYGRRGIAVNKHLAINDKRMAKGQAIIMKGQAGLILANQGIQQKSDTGQVFETIGSAVTKIMGKDTPAADQTPTENQDAVAALAPPAAYRSMAGGQPSEDRETDAGDRSANTGVNYEKDTSGTKPEKKDNTMLYVIGGIVLAAIIGGVLWWSNK